jgi:hypothetical protein
MSLPTFTHATAGTVAFSRANTYPVSSPRTPRVRVGKSDAGTIQTVVLGPAEQQYNLTFDLLPQSDLDAVRSFLETLNYAASVFTYTDVAGVSHQVRCLDHDAETRAYDVCTLRLVLLEEPET